MNTKYTSGLVMLALSASSGCASLPRNPEATHRARVESDCYNEFGKPLYQPDVSAEVEYACRLRWLDYYATWAQ